MEECPVVRQRREQLQTAGNAVKQHCLPEEEDGRADWQGVHCMLWYCQMFEFS